MAESGATSATYTLGDGEVLAQKRGSTQSYMLHDGQHSVRSLTDTSGGITDSYGYDAWGTARSGSGTTLNPYRYTGQQFDIASGLYSLRARYYTPTAGRFLSRDTLNIILRYPKGLNQYSYADADPINGFDPRGQATISTDLAPLFKFIVGFSASLLIAAHSEQLANGAAFSIKLIFDQLRTNQSGLIPLNRLNHILNGDANGGGHRAGTGISGKSEFPRIGVMRKLKRR